jgi:hypothetical protein
MDPSKIKLESVNKLFEYEKHVRIIDTLNEEELRNFSKLYCKLYLSQQEVLISMPKL